MEAPATPTTTTGPAHTPPAPRLGYPDNWEPFTPRKSTRILQQTANRTPPHSSGRVADVRHRSLESPKTPKSKPITNIAAPSLSPTKKRMPAMGSLHRVSASLTAEGTAHAATALGLSVEAKSESTLTTRTGTAGMLPTPAKTPKKVPSKQEIAKIRGFARHAFHAENDVMPSPKTRGAYHYQLDSFDDENSADEKIQIYTDSKERTPMVNNSLDNPFYGDHQPAPEPHKRRSMRRTVAIPGEGRVTIEEAIRRNDGMVTVFRGKKQFRKFTDEVMSSPVDAEDKEDDALDARFMQPLTRTSVKPRLLFARHKSDSKVSPTAAARDLEDEEAVTDIEDHNLAGQAQKEIGHKTPTELIDGSISGTPSAPKFAPASPPVTTRITRYAARSDTGATPIKVKKPSKCSPFDGWRVSKGSGGSVSGTDNRHKRQAEPPFAGSAKRAKH